MQSCIMGDYKADRSGKPMDELLKRNEEYAKSGEKYLVTIKTSKVIDN